MRQFRTSGSVGAPVPQGPGRPDYLYPAPGRAPPSLPKHLADLAWTGVKRLAREGADALSEPVEIAKPENLTSSFSSTVITSGDHRWIRMLIVFDRTDSARAQTPDRSPPVTKPRDP